MATDQLEPAGGDAPELYKLALEEKWEDVQERASKEPHEARYLNPSDGTTALHIAAKARRSFEPRLFAIRALLEANPFAASAPAEDSGFTPLAYACMVADDNVKRLEEDRQVVQLILEYNPKSLEILTEEGYSPIDLHIMYFSAAKSESGMFSLRVHEPDSTTAVLKTLLVAYDCHDIGVASKLELLFGCNSMEILENVALAEAESLSAKLHARKAKRPARSSCASVSSASLCSAVSNTVVQCWTWEWALLLLEAQHKQHHAMHKPMPQFHALHAAAQVKDCPLPFLMLAMRAFPEQVRTPDAVTGDCPLHHVASWQLAGDQSGASRKSMALSALVSEYPEASMIKNKEGKTPMSLALDTGTLWDFGVRKLTTYQKAMDSPRSVIGF